MNRRVPAVVTALLLMSTVSIVPAAAAPQRAATTCSALSDEFAPHSPQDVNNDGHSDLVVGDPSATVDGKDAAGAVEVRFGLDRSRGGTVTTPDVRITSSDLGIPDAAGAQFGASVAIADLNGDACKDLVIGAPGSARGVGAVFVAFGSPDGNLTGRLFTRGTDVGRLGSAIASAGRTVWVGAPGEPDVDDQGDGGAVYGWTFGADGSVVTSARITEETPGVVGRTETGDAFGTALAMPDENTLVVGEPYEDVGKRVDAGTVTVVRTAGIRHITGSALISQNTPGVSGTSEAGDKFGASVSAYGSKPTIAVGVPGEDLGTRANAGLVQLFTLDAKLVPHQLFSVDQDSPTISGSAEAGDAFGSSVLLGGIVQEDYNRELDVAIGVPGEDLGTVKDAGQVNVVVVSAQRNVEPFQKPGTQAQGPLYRGAPDDRNLGGTAHASDRAGAGLSALALTDNRDNADEVPVTGGEYLVVAIPGDDVGGVDAGSLSVGGTAVRNLSGPVAGERYGVGASTVPNGPYNNPV